MLKNMQVVGHGLFTPIVQPITRRIFESRTNELIKDFTKQRRFKMTLKCIQDFMKNQLNWSYKARITITRNYHQHESKKSTTMWHIGLFTLSKCTTFLYDKLLIQIKLDNDLMYGKQNVHSSFKGRRQRTICVVVSFSTNMGHYYLCKLCSKGQKIVQSYP